MAMAGWSAAVLRPCKPPNPFRYFDSSPDLIFEVVMLYVKYR